MTGRESNAAIDLARSRPIDTRLYRAPGRVNIVGEHTDYNDGLVLPTSTALYTWLVASKRSDRIITVTSANLQDTQDFRLDDPGVRKTTGWIAYAAGVAAELQAEGIPLRGADFCVDGQIPIGGGLSSSASFETVIATALLDAANHAMPPNRIAELCQRAENRHTGVNCGIMDHLAVASCRPGRAMMIDCRSLNIQFADIPADARLLITDSGVAHRLARSDYNNRASECAAAVDILSKYLPHLRSLRDLSMPQLQDCGQSIDDTLFRRCRHVVSENLRVEQAFSALSSGDLLRLGALISASHASLRDDYGVSCHEIEQLVALADDCDGVYGSRMVGAGFGGCVLSLTCADKVDEVVETVRDRYGKLIGKTPWMHVVSAAHPAGRVSHP